MSIVTPSLLSIIILEVNGLTSITQKHRVAEWIIKEDSTTKHSSKKKRLILDLRTDVGWKGIEKLFHAKWN